jgi:hypothetical protein
VREGKKHLEKTSPSATLSTTNPIWPDLGSNQSYGMTFNMFLSFQELRWHHVPDAHCSVWHWWCLSWGTATSSVTSSSSPQGCQQKMFTAESPHCCNSTLHNADDLHGLDSSLILSKCYTERRIYIYCKNMNDTKKSGAIITTFTAYRLRITNTFGRRLTTTKKNNT